MAEACRSDCLLSTRFAWTFAVNKAELYKARATREGQVPRPYFIPSEFEFTSCFLFFVFSIALKTDLNFRFCFLFSYGIWKTKIRFRFFFLAKSIETDHDNLCLGGNIKQTKMAALEDVFDKDFVCRFLIEQKRSYEDPLWRACH